MGSDGGWGHSEVKSVREAADEATATPRSEPSHQEAEPTAAEPGRELGDVDEAEPTVRSDRDVAADEGF
jgi:hypothetical protein